MFENVKSVKEMSKYNTFKFWFSRIGENHWNVIDKSAQRIVATVEEDPGLDEVDHLEFKVKLLPPMDSSDSTLVESIQYDFDRFKKTRPEYVVGRRIHIDSLEPAEAVSIYEHLIVGVALIRAMKPHALSEEFDPDSVLDKIYPCLDWLHRGDFFQAPASTRYHDCIPSGLLLHTLKVVDDIVVLHRLPMFNSIDIEDAVLCALVHDWCKIGLYEKYMRNVKNEETGQWEKVPSYRRKSAFVPLGHGVASMFLANKFFRLSPGESLAIRWHMGGWNLCQPEMDEFQQANETEPLVHMLQFADQLSITQYTEHEVS